MRLHAQKHNSYPVQEGCSFPWGLLKVLPSSCLSASLLPKLKPLVLRHPPRPNQPAASEAAAYPQAHGLAHHDQPALTSKG